MATATELRDRLVAIKRELQPHLLVVDRLEAEKKLIIDELRQHPDLFEVLVPPEALKTAEQIQTLSLTVATLNLPVRAKNCLEDEKIETIRELVHKTEEELLKIVNMGRKSVGEIKEALAALGLKLKGSP